MTSSFCRMGNSNKAESTSGQGRQRVFAPILDSAVPPSFDQDNSPVGSGRTFVVGFVERMLVKRVPQGTMMAEAVRVPRSRSMQPSLLRTALGRLRYLAEG